MVLDTRLSRIEDIPPHASRAQPAAMVMDEHQPAIFMRSEVMDASRNSAAN